MLTKSNLFAFLHYCCFFVCHSRVRDPRVEAYLSSFNSQLCTRIVRCILKTNGLQGLWGELGRKDGIQATSSYG